jgi:tetratricopeptide (TPR) repeat protein
MCDIKYRLLKIAFVFMMTGVSSTSYILAQQSQPVPSRQSSTDAFTKGDYEQAYNDFSFLLQKYPKDPLYKYYSGACLVMMKKDPEEAVSLLQQSISGASVVRSLPPDALFYLGRAQQMSGKYSEAIASFSAYTDQVGKKVAREKDVPGYIQECENKKGMVAASAAIPAPKVADKKTEAGKPAEMPAVSDTEKKTAGAVTSERKGLPPDYEKILDEALKVQYKADSLTQVAGEQKKQLENIPESERYALRMKISQNEILAAAYQKSADMKYNEAQVKMYPKHDTVPQKRDTMPKTVKNEPVAVAETKIAATTTGQTVTMKKETPVAGNAAGTFSFFQVLPKGAPYPDDKIKIDPEVPAGLIYRIQLAVFRNPVPPSVFKGITPVYGFKVPGTDKTNYYAGMFRRSADAKKALSEVKETGFKDAFIVSMADNKPVSPDRAAVLENEWGMKPFIDQTQLVATPDTIPPALAFRVEVVRSMKPLKPDAVEALRTMAGSRGLDILHLTDGNNVYLIGKFITFESAAEYADLLVRNNYRTAKVVAWLGNKEVPVETARELFNNLQ